MSRRLATAGAALLLVAAANVAVEVGSHNPLKTVGAVLLVLILPGAAVALAAGRGFDPAERVLWIAVSSVAVVILLGLALDLAPGGLSRRNWLVALDVVVLAAVAVLLTRPAVSLRRPPPEVLRSWAVPGLVLAVAFATATVAVVVGVRGAHKADRLQSFVQLWALPQGRHLQIGARSAVEDGAGNYRVVLYGNGTRLRAFAFRLPWGRDWRTELTLSSKRAAYLVILYDADGRALHRLRVTVPTPA